MYFADRLYTEDELPAEFKLYLPIRQSQSIGSTIGGDGSSDL